MEEPIPVRYTFVMLLAIADPEGIVVGTDIAISRRFNMPVEEFKSCIESLGRPDPGSNSKELDGRRVVKNEGERGYFIVNYGKYRDLKGETEKREYMRDYMRKRRENERNVASGKAVKVNSKPALNELTDVTHIDADAEEEPNAEVDSEVKDRRSGFLIEDEIYQAYPKKKGRGQAIKAIRVALQKIPASELLEAVKKYAASTVGKDLQFEPHPATWFNGEHWLDEPIPAFTPANHRPTPSEIRNSQISGCAEATARRLAIPHENYDPPGLL